MPTPSHYALLHVRVHTLVVTTIATLAAILAVCSMQPNAAHAVGYGSEIHNWQDDVFSFNSAYSGYNDMGLGWDRVLVAWSWVQPNSTSWNWVGDGHIRSARDHGLNVMVNLAFAPAWANGGHSSDKYPPDKSHMTAWGNYCKESAKRYAPMGVHAYEIWNEPNHLPFFKPQPSPGIYTTLLKSCYLAIKAADPSATVITGGMSPKTDTVDYSEVAFLKAIYAKGGGKYFDAVGQHPYSYPTLPSDVHTWNSWSIMGDLSTSQGETLRSVMKANKDNDKKIWATEWGAPTAPTVDSRYTETRQSEIIEDGMRRWAGYSWAGVLFAYQYRDEGTSTTSREQHFGLSTYSGSHKRAFYTVRDNSWLGLFGVPNVYVSAPRVNQVVSGTISLVAGGSQAKSALFTELASGKTIGIASCTQFGCNASYDTRGLANGTRYIVVTSFDANGKPNQRSGSYPVIVRN